MRRRSKALSVFVIVLLTSLAIGDSALNLAGANPFGQPKPKIEPDNYYIMPDGSVFPDSAPIRREGNVYTLTGDVIGHEIWVSVDGALLDGAGYTVKNNQTGEGTGVTLNCTKNVIIKNIRVEGFNWGTGITVNRMIYQPSLFDKQPYPTGNPYPISSGNTIINCELKNNNIGIGMHNSPENRIVNNTITGSNIGIQLVGSEVTASEITHNLIKFNGKGIYLDSSSNNNIIFANQIVENSIYGIALAWSSNNTVQNNLITKNDIGILVCSLGIGVKAEQNTIIYNQIIQNNQWGIRLNGSQTGNKIYANNFVDNNLGKGLQVSIPMFMDSGIGYINYLPGPANTWNNASAGNYWSDYQTRYPNATKNADTDVWDTLFYINENNIDKYPLTGQLNIEIPDFEEEQSNLNIQNSQIPILPYLLILPIVTLCIVICIFLLIYKKRNKKSLTL